VPFSTLSIPRTKIVAAVESRCPHTATAAGTPSIATTTAARGERARALVQLGQPRMTVVLKISFSALATAYYRILMPLERCGLSGPDHLWGWIWMGWQWPSLPRSHLVADMGAEFIHGHSEPSWAPWQLRRCSRWGRLGRCDFRLG
jgi:hypothetical protein